MTRELTLLNRYGMHVRPAGLFAKVASRYDASVEVEKDGNVVSGKSIMALMTLEATCGTVLKVTASGPQAAEVLDELEALVGRKFDIPDEQYGSNDDDCGTGYRARLRVRSSLRVPRRRAGARPGVSRREGPRGRRADAP